MSETTAEYRRRVGKKLTSAQKEELRIKDMLAEEQRQRSIGNESAAKRISLLIAAMQKPWTTKRTSRGASRKKRADEQIPRQARRRDALYGLNETPAEIAEAFNRLINGSGTPQDQGICQRHIEHKKAEIRARKIELGIEGQSNTHGLWEIELAAFEQRIHG